QLIRKLAGHWVNSVEQEQVRHGRGRTRNIGDASPARDAPPRNPASTEMQNLWPIVPGLNERECDRSLPRKPYRAQRPVGNRREGSLDHEQLPYSADPRPRKGSSLARQPCPVPGRCKSERQPGHKI